MLDNVWIKISQLLRETNFLILAVYLKWWKASFQIDDLFFHSEHIIKSNTDVLSLLWRHNKVDTSIDGI